MSMRRVAALTIAFVVAITLAGGPGASGAAGQTGPRTDSMPGLLVTPFSVPEGTLRVYLPDDMAAGDTISGTVVAEPAGNTDAERSANSSTLDGYVIDVGTKKISIAQHALTFILPVASAKAGLVIRRSNGGEVHRISVPVRAQQPAFGRVPLPNDFRFPQIVAAGRPFPINGPFGGDFAKSSLLIGGQPASKIAESPRTLIAAPASNVTGPTSYQLNENGVAVTAHCNVVSLKLTAPKTQLTKGEHTAVHVQISGLDGIREPAPVRIVNVTPGVVTLSGGPTQELNVRPGDVRPDGTYSTDRDITALVAGSFSIYSTIDVQRGPFNNGTPVATALSPPPLTQATATPHAKKNPITSDWPQLSADDQKSVQAQLDKGAGSRADALAELVKIMKKYCCNFDTMANGTPVYDPNTEGEGATERKKGGKVSMGPDAFSSVAWLYSSLKHEMVHSQHGRIPTQRTSWGRRVAKNKPISAKSTTPRTRA